MFLDAKKGATIVAIHHSVDYRAKLSGRYVRTVSEMFIREISLQSSCPCCFDTKFPEPTLAITQEEFANVRPKFTKDTVILRDCPLLDDSTGEDITKTIMVHVITVEPVVSTATASHFKFRSSDGDDHRGYEVIIPTMRTVADDVDEVWQLVRTSESDSSALSFIRIGCFDSLFGEQTTSLQSGLAAARHVGTLLRRATPYREANSGRAPATVDGAFKKRDCEGHVFVSTESAVLMVMLVDSL
jgi:hypothetical protein